LPAQTAEKHEKVLQESNAALHAAKRYTDLLEGANDDAVLLLRKTMSNTLLSGNPDWDLFKEITNYIKVNKR
jgi:hypothetical protein